MSQQKRGQSATTGEPVYVCRSVQGVGYLKTTELSKDSSRLNVVLLRFELFSPEEQVSCVFVRCIYDYLGRWDYLDVFPWIKNITSSPNTELNGYLKFECLDKNL